MNPRHVSAQFAAFVWFTGRTPAGHADPAAARRFARENWTAFLPCAHEGLGRLLMRIASRHTAAARGRRVQPATGVPRSRRRRVAVAV
jgi:hypothetical protein